MGPPTGSKESWRATKQQLQQSGEDELPECCCAEKKVEIDGPDEAAEATAKNKGRRKRREDGDDGKKDDKEWKELDGDAMKRRRKKFRSIAYIYSITRPISQSL